MRISDWSSDVCSSDLRQAGHQQVSLVQVFIPHRCRQQHQRYPEHHLQSMPPHQRTQVAAQCVQLSFAKDMQLSRVLLVKAVIEGLPGIFEVVEFHDRFHVEMSCGWAQERSLRMRGLSRLILVATLVSERLGVWPISRSKVGGAAG